MKQILLNALGKHWAVQLGSDQHWYVPDSIKVLFNLQN